MKILVGTLYCAEQEFEQCRQAILRQTYDNVEHVVIQDLPNAQAHDALYGMFMEKVDEFDLFIKIDADMVLSRDTFFQEVVDEMNRYSDSNHFEIGVFDHFTRCLIYGLHVYRSDVRWDKNAEDVFVDRVHTPTRRRVYMDTRGPLAPAADHCPDPSAFQAFHYGVHKAVKLMQHGLSQKNVEGAYSHARKIYALWKAFDERAHPLSSYVMAGVFWAFEHQANGSDLDYGSDRVLQAYEEFNRRDVRFDMLNRAREYMMHLPLDVWCEHAVDVFFKKTSPGRAV